MSEHGHARVETELRQYIETALWSSSIEENFAAQHNAATGEDWAADTSMESFGFTADDLAPEALESMRADVEAFIAGATLQSALDFWEYELGLGQVGHDFWLTRNGHGAGFWNRFSGDHTPGAMFGHILTEDAKPYGESDLYVGDDGRIYVS